MEKKIFFSLLFVFILIFYVPAGLSFVQENDPLTCTCPCSSDFQSSAKLIASQLRFSGHKLLFSVGHGEDDTYIVDIRDWFESLGGTAVIDNDTLSAADFNGVTAALIGSIFQPPDNFSIAEANVIRDWFLGAPHRFLWVGGDSDHWSGWVPMNASMILETVGSHLRMEPSSVEDPVSNCGLGYRVVCNWTNTADPVVAPIISDVDRVLFHTPTLLYGVNATGSPVPIDTITGGPSIIPNVHIIMQTGASGSIIDHTPTSFPMYAHTHLASGHFAMMAAELNISGIENKLIASSSPPYGDWEPLWSDSHYGYNLNGSTLVKNTIKWGLSYYPSAPVLADPGSLDNDGILNITWSESIDTDGYVTQYQLQMSNLGTFSTLLASWNTSNLHQAINILYDGIYYFRVRAFDNIGNPSVWSNTEEITVQINTSTISIPSFPVAAITIGLVFAIGLSVFRRRKKH